MGNIFKVLFDFCQMLLFVIGMYYLVVAVFSLTIINKKTVSGKNHSFAIVVAAHNEETVIGQLVESLNNLKYPKTLYKIFVVADNCDDATAEEARRAGAVVLEREDNENCGKGFAMEFAFEHLFSLEEQFEYICVFDADNIVDCDFLFHMNNKINEGWHAVQGYIDSKNPSESWLSFSYSLWYWINNRVAQLSRGNLGLGCRLGGTGFAVATNLIKRFGWGATCLAEDTEFTLKLALSDLRVGWAHEAVIYDEKPVEFKTSVHQRRRWMQGLSDVAVNYVKPLIKKGIDDRKAFPFHMLMNFWSDCLYPTATMFFTATYILTFIAEKNSFLYQSVCEIWAEPFRMLLLTFFVWGNIIITALGLYSDRKLDKNIIKNFLGFIIYILSWIPIGIIGFLKKDEKEWFHTPHSPK